MTILKRFTNNTTLLELLGKKQEEEKPKIEYTEAENEVLKYIDEYKAPGVDDEVDKNRLSPNE